MANNDPLIFLLSNSGTVIKHLLYKGADDTQSEAFRTNCDDLLMLPAVTYWKKRIPMRVDVAGVLGSSDSCFENSFGKLLAYGLSANEILSKKALPGYLSFLKGEERGSVYDSLARFVVAGYLAASGLSHEIVDGIVLQRIDSLHGFVTGSSDRFNIYSEPAEVKIPAQYRSKKLVNPVLYQNNELVLPLIYDIFVFYHIYDKAAGSLKTKMDAIIEYISDSRYQAFDYGYGLIRRPKNKFHFMGWSAHLPFYNDSLASGYFEKGLVYRMLLFSKFKNPVVQRWLGEMLAKLDDYRVNGFQYCFPNDILPETKNSYFMNGRHMGLNENRIKKIGRMVESTYYIYEIQKNRMKVN